MLRAMNYYVSPGPKPGFKLHPAFYAPNGSPVDHIFFSAYEASYYDASLGRYFSDGTDTDSAVDYTNDRLCSLPGKKPISSAYKRLTRSAFETMAQARGAGWHIETVKSHTANHLLMLIEAGGQNLQNVLGKGVSLISDSSGVCCTSLSGSTSFLGNASGMALSTDNDKNGTVTAYTDDGRTAVSYRGVENPWWNIWKHLNGINIYCDGGTGVAQSYIAEDFDFADEKTNGNYRPAGFSYPGAKGYVKYPGYGGAEHDWLLLPAVIGGSASDPVGDYILRTQNDSGHRIPQVGGRWDFGSYGGMFCCNIQRSADYCNRDFGCRLLFTG